MGGLVFRVQAPGGMSAGNINAIRGKTSINYPLAQINWNRVFTAMMQKYQPTGKDLERVVREFLQTHEAGGSTT
jgi:hypothetical protein